MFKKKPDFIVVILLIILFIIGVIVILRTSNSFGGADNIAHYFAAHYGWKYPKLLFDHWSKPIFTILSSPFAQFGINGIRIYNLLLGLMASFLAYKTSRLLNIQASIISLAFTILAPVYFILMFTSLTEISFAFFLILGVYLFFSNRYIWSAIIISFLPIIRTEGIILFPLFALAYGLRKSYLSILSLSFGFILISILGFPFHKSIFWLITEMPYGGANIYGSGQWMHFISNTKNITGIFEFVLFLLGFVLLLIKYFKKGILTIEKEFYILLLIFAPFILYFAAHSYVWAMGKGGSLGLIRVIGAVVPLAAIGASFGFDLIYGFIYKKSKYISYAIVLLIVVFLFKQSKHIYAWGFYKTSVDKLIKQSSDYIKNNSLDKYHLVYYDVDVIYELGRDPYDNTKTSWMIHNRKSPSMPFPDSTIIVWDSHFGNNEGQMPLSNLLNDPKLVLLKKIEPEKPTKTLGGYNYEIDIFQKIDTNKNKLHITNYFDNFNYEKKTNNEDSICVKVMTDNEFSPGFSTRTSNLCKKFANFNIYVSFDIKKIETQKLKDIILVLSIENGDEYIYKPYDFSSLVTDNKWNTIKYRFNNIKISPSKELLKIYIWNKGKNEFLLDNLRIDFKKID